MRKQVRAFLGVSEFCRIWVLGFVLAANPLCEALEGSDTDLLYWIGEQQENFQRKKEISTEVPGVGIPNLENPFILFVA